MTMIDSILQEMAHEAPADENPFQMRVAQC